jgi:hypothetical protein
MTQISLRAVQPRSAGRGTRVLPSLLGILVATLLASCGGSARTHVVVRSAGPDAVMSGKFPLGVVTGAIFFGGGPAVPSNRLAMAGSISVLGSTGKVFTHTHARAGQHFRLWLPPGRYEVTTGQELHPKSGCSPERVLVRAGRTSHVDVYVNCSIP